MLLPFQRIVGFKMYPFEINTYFDIPLVHQYRAVTISGQHVSLERLCAALLLSALHHHVCPEMVGGYTTVVTAFFNLP